MGKRAIWVVVLILTIGFTPSAYAFFETYGAGIRANAMGGAFTAVADDPTAAYYNPAGLAQNHGHVISVEYFYFRPDFSIKNTSGEDLEVRDANGRELIDPIDGSSGSSSLLAPVLGIEFDINKMMEDIFELPFNTQLALLAGIPDNASKLMQVAMIAPDLPHFIAFGDSVNHLNAYLAGSVEVIEDLFYVGAGAAVSVIVAGDLIGPDTQVTGDPSVLHGYVATDTSLDLLGGVLVTPFDKMLRAGFTYKQETYYNVDPLQLLAQLDLSLYGVNPVDINLITNSLVAYRPAEYNFGIAVELEEFPFMDMNPFPFKSLMISIDVCMQEWSKYEYSKLYSYYITPDNPFLVGEVTNPDFEDTTEYKIGVKYAFNENLTGMAGFQVAISPVPDQSRRITNYLDMDRNIYSAGGTYKFTDWPVTLSGMITYSTFDGFYVDNEGNKGIAWGWESGVESYQESFEVESGSVFTIGLGGALTF